MKKPFLIVLLAIGMQLQLHAQVVSQQKNADVKDVVTKLQTLSTDRVIEKAYLQFDKSYYDPGDTIYFRAYITAGEKHELSKISGVLHVELISKNDSVMQSQILQLTNGQAWGDLSLPNYIPKGNYRVRAYTQWMQNQGSKYIFDKNIPVTGRSISKVSAARPADKKVDIQFFPEGGTFVNSVPSKIGFKAIGGDGIGIDVKGTVVDNNNKEITKFTSTRLGMGQFFVTPQDGKTYKAKLTYPDGTAATVDLPAAQIKGMALAVNDETPGKLSIDINANKPYYLDNKNKEITIVIYASGLIKTVKTILDNQVIGLDLPVKDFKTGIVHITVFSQDGTPLNERLTFVQNTDLLKLVVNAKQSYYPNQQTSIALNAKDGDGKTTSGYFSVAVTDDSRLPADENAEQTILSELLLSSELKGNIEQPNYYFTASNADAKASLDVLMLTQGYRRFEWNELLNQPAPAVAYNPENGLKISGTMTTKEGKPVPNEKLSLLLASSGQSLTAMTDANGKFVFRDLGFNDNTKFLLKTENQALRSKTKIMLDRTFDGIAALPNGKPLNKLADNLPANILTRSNTDLSKTRQLQQVDVNGKSVYRTTSLAGAGNADQVITYKDFKHAVKLSDVLSGLVRGVTFKNGQPYLKNSLVVGQTGQGMLPMMIIVDGTTGIESVDNYNPADIERVEVLKGANASIYGLQAAGGVMILTSRQGGDDLDKVISVEMSPGLLSISPQGFYKGRVFYTPRYAATDATYNYNGTVLWKPNLMTDKDGNASFDVVNPPKPGNYRMVIEGIDGNGNLGRSVIKYKVQ
ncbi:TonB-dependent receptor plug domain-containing protein [Mucilaginibacter sp.]|uniref:TonB-dependent receptor plug domain-containing protein n=1 Tax=Mucilaginibacter sp. TaxID=1882438 RepID=UPI0035BC0A39